MRVVAEGFKIIIVGKCETEKDILQLFDFGFSKENIIKKYKKDNKLKIQDARKRVENILLENILKGKE